MHLLRRGYLCLGTDMHGTEVSTLGGDIRASLSKCPSGLGWAKEEDEGWREGGLLMVVWVFGGEYGKSRSRIH